MNIKLAALLFALCSTAQAQFFSGNKLLEYCRSAEASSVASGVCSGYIVGVIDSNVTRLCIPADVTVGQVRDVAVRFLETAPQFRHEQAAAVVIASMWVAWPCRKDESRAKPWQ